MTIQLSDLVSYMIFVWCAYLVLDFLYDIVWKRSRKDFGNDFNSQIRLGFAFLLIWLNFKG
jgi:hypothetical protein